MVLRKLISEFDADSDGQFTLSELRQLGRDLCIPYQEQLKFEGLRENNVEQEKKVEKNDKAGRETSVWNNAGK
ncbi:hypothetical protein ACTXT7_005862 [Hymenolepis weldensis]